MKKFLNTIALVGTLSLAACASNNNQYAGDVYDPIEPVNRRIFAFNEGVDYILLDPLTDVYRFVVPDAFRIAIGNFLNQPEITCIFGQ